MEFPIGNLLKMPEKPFQNSGTSPSYPRLYFIFVIVFLAMHLTGSVMAEMRYICNALVTFSVVAISLILLDKWHSGNSMPKCMRNLGLHSASLISLLPGIYISLALLLSYPLLSLLLGAELRLHEDWLLNLAGLCLTAGLAEEMLFRGFLFRHLREQMTYKKAALVSLLIFSAAHLVMFTYMEWSIAFTSTLLAVFMSVPLAYLFEHGDNTVWAPAMVHTTVRTIGLVVTTSEEPFMPLALTWMAACMLVPYLVLLFYKDFRSVWRS